MTSGDITLIDSTNVRRFTVALLKHERQAHENIGRVETVRQWTSTSYLPGYGNHV